MNASIASIADKAERQSVLLWQVARALNKSKYNRMCEKHKLGDICDILNGRNQKKVEDINGKYPIYGSGGIMGYANDYICKAGTTIIGRKGSINKPLYVDTEFWNVDTAFGLQPKECCHSRFLYYLCKSIDFTRYDKGVTIPSLVKSDLLQIPVSIPRLEEQSRIVEELDLLSNIIEKKRQQLSELDNLAQSIFYDMFGDPVTNEKGWEVKTVGQLFELKAGKAIKANELVNEYEDGLYACYGGNGIRGYIPKFSHSGCYPIIGRQGALCGNVNLAKGDFYATEHAVVVSCNGNADAVWTYYCMVLMNLNRYAKGVAQPGISVNVINAVNIILPSLELQQLFAQKIEAIEKQKELIKQSIAETEELFNSRMDYYFS